MNLTDLLHFICDISKLFKVFYLKNKTQNQNPDQVVIQQHQTDCESIAATITTQVRNIPLLL